MTRSGGAGRAVAPDMLGRAMTRPPWDRGLFRRSSQRDTPPTNAASPTPGFSLVQCHQYGNSRDNAPARIGIATHLGVRYSTITQRVRAQAEVSGDRGDT